MRIMTKDFADKRWLRLGIERKWTEQDEMDIDNAFITGFKFIGALLALMLFLSALSTLAHAETIKVEKTYPMTDVKLSKKDRKLLVGPQMKAYEKLNHTKVQDLGEVE
jgi:hypothetical protein